jgi:hypothetical protein
LQYLFSNDPNALILTNYPVAYVSGRENSQVTFGYTDTEEFKRLVQNDRITHLLVPTTGINTEITNQIEQWVNDGYLSFVFQDKGSSTIPYRLYIIRR